MAAPSWLPTTSALWSLLKNKAIGNEESGTDAFGGQLPDFTDDTTVTTVQAQAAIDNVYPDIEAVVGLDDADADPPAAIRPQLAGLARLVCLYFAAADVEAVSGNLERATWFKNRGDEKMKRLETLAGNLASNDLPGPDDNVGSGSVIGYFRASRLVDCNGRPKVV